MKVKYSKDFEKAVRKLSGKMLQSVRSTIKEVIEADSIDDIMNCKKLVDYDSIYRIRIGNYRAFFYFDVEIVSDEVRFLYLIARGEAYDKKNKEKLKREDSK